jgi:hypothetical protein
MLGRKCFLILLQNHTDPLVAVFLSIFLSMRAPPTFGGLKTGRVEVVGVALGVRGSRFEIAERNPFHES